MNVGLFLIIAICCGLLPIIISVNEKIRRIKRDLYRENLLMLRRILN